MSLWVWVMNVCVPICMQSSSLYICMISLSCSHLNHGVEPDSRLSNISSIILFFGYLYLFTFWLTISFGRIIQIFVHRFEIFCWLLYFYSAFINLIILILLYFTIPNLFGFWSLLLYLEIIMYVRFLFSPLFPLVLVISISSVCAYAIEYACVCRRNSCVPMYMWVCLGKELSSTSMCDSR